MVERGQGLVALHDVPLDAPLQFAQANRAEVERSTIAFTQVIRAVHHAGKEHAVAHAEHVPGLMNEHFAAPPEHDRFIVGSALLTVKGRIVKREAVNAHALMERCLTENEIPGGRDKDRPS